MGITVANAPTLIEHKNMKFLILDAPSETNFPAYLKEFQKHGVGDIVRVCEASYPATLATDHDIKVTDWPFADGEAPPDEIVSNWVSLCNNRFSSEEPEQQKSRCVAVHCVAGLGRAPVLVAIMLMEAGMDAEEAIELIRRKRRGAINNKQITFLQGYTATNGNGGCPCTIL